MSIVRDGLRRIVARGGSAARWVAALVQPFLPRRSLPFHRGERAALRHCSELGWEILATNLRLGHDEADLVCLDDAGRAVLVEVKSGAADGLDPLLHLDAGKRRRLRRLALRLAREPVLGSARGFVPRIDVIIVTLGATPAHDRVRDHYRQAVEARERRVADQATAPVARAPWRLWR